MSKCEVHNSELEDGKANIRYGLIVLPDEYRKAREKLFPNANSFVLGGCIIGGVSETQVKFCRLCREAERKHSKLSFASRIGRIRLL